MNIFVVGATGRTGRQVVEQALARGHGVTAMIRRPGAFDPHEKLRSLIGNPTISNDLRQGLEGCDAVISCLGQRSKEDATLLHDSAAAMLAAMRGHAAKPYLVVSQGLLFPSRSPIIAVLRFLLRRYIADSAAMERLVQASDVDWVIVRPPRLADGGLTRGYRIKVSARPGGSAVMQRADLSSFLVDEVEKREHLRAIVGVTSA